MGVGAHCIDASLSRGCIFKFGFGFWLSADSSCYETIWEVFWELIASLKEIWISEAAAAVLCVSLATAESVSLCCWRCDRESVGLLWKSDEPKFEINVKQGRTVFRGCAGTAVSSTPLPLTPQLMTRRSRDVLLTPGRPHLGSTFSSLSCCNEGRRAFDRHSWLSL